MKLADDFRVMRIPLEHIFLGILHIFGILLHCKVRGEKDDLAAKFFLEDKNWQALPAAAYRSASCSGQVSV